MLPLTLINNTTHINNEYKMFSNDTSTEEHVATNFMVLSEDVIFYSKLFKKMNTESEKLK